LELRDGWVTRDEQIEPRVTEVGAQ
jgi:hypothetical protein